MKGILQWLFTKPTGLAVLAALIIAGAAAYGKTYYQETYVPEDIKEAKSVRQRLTEVGHTLTAIAKKQPPGTKEPFPAPVAWTPANYVCGLPNAISEADKAHAAWSLGKLDLGKEEMFQFAFRPKGNRAQLMARADYDCDGVFVVYHLECGTEIGDDGCRAIIVDNPAE